MISITARILFSLFAVAFVAGNVMAKDEIKESADKAEKAGEKAKEGKVGAALKEYGEALKGGDKEAEKDGDKKK